MFNVLGQYQEGTEEVFVRKPTRAEAEACIIEIKQAYFWNKSWTFRIVDDDKETVNVLNPRGINLDKP